MEMISFYVQSKDLICVKGKHQSRRVQREGRGEVNSWVIGCFFDVDDSPVDHQ